MHDIPTVNPKEIADIINDHDGTDTLTITNIEVDFSDTEITNRFFRNIKFVNCTIKGANFKTMIFVGCRFTKVTFRDTDFAHSTIHKCRFEDVYFVTDELASSYSLFTATTFDECEFSWVHLTNMRLINTKIQSSYFLLSDFTNTWMENLLLRKVTASHCEFSDANFLFCEFDDTTFDFCSLSAIDTRETTLKGEVTFLDCYEPTVVFTDQGVATITPKGNGANIRHRFRFDYARSDALRYLNDVNADEVLMVLMEYGVNVDEDGRDQILAAFGTDSQKEEARLRILTRNSDKS